MHPASHLLVESVQTKRSWGLQNNVIICCLSYWQHFATIFIANTWKLDNLWHSYSASTLLELASLGDLVWRPMLPALTKQCLLPLLLVSIFRKKHTFRWILDRKSQHPAAGLRSPGANMRAWGHFQGNTSQGFNSSMVPLALAHAHSKMQCQSISSSQALDAILIANCKPLAHIGHFRSLPSSEQVSCDLSAKVCGTHLSAKVCGTPVGGGRKQRLAPFLLLMHAVLECKKRDTIWYNHVSHASTPSNQIYPSSFVTLLYMQATSSIESTPIQ